MEQLFFLYIYILWCVRYTNAEANEDQKAKLAKLLSLWESKANFFDACVISKLKSPMSSMQEYRTNLLNQFGSVVAAIPQSTNATFERYVEITFIVNYIV